MAGKIPTFTEGEEDWDSYQERLECYFKVKAVKNDVKVHTLITGLQASQYQVLKNLLAPEKPSDKSYEDVVGVMSKHYGGGKNARVERSKFRSVVRKAEETIQAYSIRLKQAARHCDFGANLDQMMVDQFIAGVKSQFIANKLLEATEGLALTFSKALEIAVAAEVNEKSSAIYAKSQEEQVHAVTSKNYKKKFTSKKPTVQYRQQGKRRCYRCNAEGHMANECKHQDAKCHKCGRKGHLAAACRDGQVPRGKAQQHMVEGDHTEPESETSANYEDTGADTGEYSMFSIDLQLLSVGTGDLCMTRNDKKFFVGMELNGCEIEFEVDTGAIVTCVSEQTYKKWCKPGEKLMPVDLKLRDYNKKPLDIAGVAMVTAVYKSVRKTIASPSRTERKTFSTEGTGSSTSD